MTVGALAILSATIAAWVSVRYSGQPARYTDQWFHLHLAGQWRSGEGLTTSAEISAGYPLFVAFVDLIRSAAGHPDLVTAVGVAQSLLLGATVVVTGLLGRRVAGPAAGITAAAILAVWPNVVIGAALVMSEPLATLLGALVVLLLVWVPRPSWRRVTVAAALLALAIEVRPGTLVLLALFAAVPAGGSWRDRGRSLALGAGVVLLVVLPFAIRSSYVSRTFVPLDLRQGASLCLGRLPEADGGPIAYESCPASPGASAVEANRERLHRAWRLLRAHPGREPRLVVGRLDATVWFPDRSSIDELDRRDGRHLGFDGADRWARLSTMWSRLVLLGAAMGTALALLRRDRRLALAALAGWLLLAVPLVSLGDPRFRVPSLPFFAVAAASALIAGVRRLRGGPPAAGSPFSVRGVRR